MSDGVYNCRNHVRFHFFQQEQKAEAAESTDSQNVNSRRLQNVAWSDEFLLKNTNSGVGANNMNPWTQPTLY